MVMNETDVERTSVSNPYWWKTVFLSREMCKFEICGHEFSHYDEIQEHACIKVEPQNPLQYNYTIVYTCSSTF